MDRKEIISYKPQCYKINADFRQSNSSDIIEKLVVLGDVCFDNGKPVVFLNFGKTKNNIKSILKKFKIDEYYIEEICADSCENQDSVLAVWFCEHYDEAIRSIIQQNYSEQIQLAKENAKKILEKEETNNG